jgi:hypothetical protein
MSLHAGVFVAAAARDRLRRICRYTARPAIAVERLKELPDGRLAYALRTPWHDGTTHVVFEPQEIMARLAAQIPPPRAHQTRYHGILAPAAAWRSAVVPTGDNSATPEFLGAASVPPRQRPKWAVLLQKTFAVDALECLRCGGRMHPVAVVTAPDEIRAVLARIYADYARPP